MGTDSGDNKVPVHYDLTASPEAKVLFHRRFLLQCQRIGVRKVLAEVWLDGFEAGIKLPTTQNPRRVMGLSFYSEAWDAIQKDFHP